MYNPEFTYDHKHSQPVAVAASTRPANFTTAINSSMAFLYRQLGNTLSNEVETRHHSAL